MTFKALLAPKEYWKFSFTLVELDVLEGKVQRCTVVDVNA